MSRKYELILRINCCAINPADQSLSDQFFESILRINHCVINSSNQSCGSIVPINTCGRIDLRQVTICDREIQKFQEYRESAEKSISPLFQERYPCVTSKFLNLERSRKAFVIGFAALDKKDLKSTVLFSPPEKNNSTE